MTDKNYSLFAVLAAIIMIPQLLFWWLAPQEAAARLAVYIGATILTVGIPVAYYVTYRKSNLRKTAGLAIVCCILEIVAVGLSVLLLALNTSVRSAVFAFIITVLICISAITPMISTALKCQTQGVYPASASAEAAARPTGDLQDRGSRIYGTQPNRPVPPHIPRPPAASRPMPPKKR